MSASEGSVASREAGGVRLAVVFLLALGTVFLADLLELFLDAFAPFRGALPAGALLESASAAGVSTTSDSFLVFLGTVLWDC